MQLEILARKNIKTLITLAAALAAWSDRYRTKIRMEELP